MMPSQFQNEHHCVYLNHAAVGPWPQKTADAIQNFAQENLQNGARFYPRWLEKEYRLREQFARLIGHDNPMDMALLKSTSEALSVVAYGIDWQAGDNIVLSDMEFPSNRIVWESLQTKGVEVRVVKTTPHQLEQQLIAAMDEHTRLLTTSSVHYATGLRVRLETLGQACRDYGTLFNVDAIQSLGAIPFDNSKVKADFIMADGHKWLLGPEGLALFYCNPELRNTLTLQQYGWHMIANAGNYGSKQWEVAQDATRFECGSPNMLTIHALSASLDVLMDTGLDQVHEQLNDNVRYLIHQLQQLPGIMLHTETAPDRLAGIINFSVEGYDNQSLYEQLMQLKVVCAARGPGIRWAPHFYQSKTTLDQAVRLLKSLI